VLGEKRADPAVCQRDMKSFFYNIQQFPLRNVVACL
jgi:hypothetical protein